jgi:serine/threonine protein kinase
MSDVWSYGMTLYNFVTQIPPFDYLTRNTKKKLDKMEFYNELVNNMRKPKIVDKFEIEHPKLVKLMRSMWEIEPEKRPTCKDIRRKLGKIYNKLP